MTKAKKKPVAQKATARTMWLRRLRYGSVIGLAIFMHLLVINGLLQWYFSDKSYPLTRSYNGIALGGQKSQVIEAQLREKIVLPKTLTFTHDGKAFTTSPQTLGVAVDHAAMKDEALQHELIALVGLFSPRRIALDLQINDKLFQSELTKLTKPLQKEPKNAAFIIQDGNYTVRAEEKGIGIDTVKTGQELLYSLESGKNQVPVTITAVSPRLIASNLEASATAAKEQLQTSVTITFQDKKATASPTDRAAWFIIEETKLTLSEKNIEAYLRSLAGSWNMQITNLSDSVRKIYTAVNEKKSQTIALQGTILVKPPKAFTYCVQARNVDTVLLQELAAKLKTTYADKRGWSLGGKMIFTEVKQGCNFTIWLSAADQLPLFSSGCSAEWSCRGGNNVIGNIERWRSASTSWNAAGSNLDDYRSMLINHETGHYLGFDHYDCSGPGQPAPVMLQQSIDLQGCAFNPWPVASEIAAVTARYGL